MRRNFTFPEDANLRAIQLSINYDDGFVAYLNGREISRSANMEEAGNPPPHDALATQNRESNQGDQVFDLARYHQFFRPYPQVNTLAVQGL